jgi:chromosome segregation ATPase
VGRDQLQSDLVQGEQSFTCRVVTADGTVLDAGGIMMKGPRSGPTASTGTGNLQVVWSVLTSLY